MHEKNSHCSYCGHAFAVNQPWPRRCAGCDNTSFVNPLPVAVLLLPVDDGIVVIRRGIPPQEGWLALPGGFIDFGETWQAGAARELYEETYIRIPPEDVALYRVASTPHNQLLIFGLAKPRTEAELPPFVPTNETTERMILRGPRELAFLLHTQALEDYFAGRTSAR